MRTEYPWPTVRLDDICSEVTVGFVGPMAREYRAAGVPFIRSLNVKPFRIERTDIKFVSLEFHEKIRKSRLRAGDVVIVRTGIPGTTAVVPEWLDGGNCSDLVIARPSDALDAFFLCYFMNAVAHDVGRMYAVGAVQQHFNVGSAKTLKIPLPPLPEQRAIAGVLGALDDKIEVNQKMARVLEGIALAVFTSWFVDFDPVRRAATGQPTGLPPDLTALFPKRLVDSPIGEVPEGWRVGTIGDIADAARDGVDPGAIDADTPYIGLEHMPRRCIALDQWENAGKVTSGKSRFQRGQILFGKLRPYFHKVGVAPVDGVCSTDIIVAEPRKPCWMALAIGHLSSDALVKRADGSSTGTKMPRTHWRDLAAFEIAIPPEPIAAKASYLIAPIVQRMEASTHANRTLAALRDALLPKLISGELRIADAEKIVGRAV